MQKLPSGLVAGQHVDVRGETWRIVELEPFDALTLVTLRGVGPDNLGRRVRLLAPFDRVRVRTRPTRLARSTRRHTLRRAIGAYLESPPWDQSWVGADARLDLRAWQFTAARAAIHGATRLLLADGVGLGKTIQALLVVVELFARGLARRALVLTPASVRQQWADEMRDRFDLDPQVFDHAAIVEATARVPPSVNPWVAAPLIVSSIDFVKRADVRHAAEEMPLDLLIVDEAHHLRPGSDRADLVRAFAMRARWVVLCTATPHSGDEAAYRSLLSTGALPGGADMVVIRHGDETRGESARRSTRTLAVKATPAERLLLAESLAYVRALQRVPGGEDGSWLVAAVIARRAASSADAAVRTLERRLALLEGRVAPSTQPVLPWDDIADDDLDSDRILGLPGLADTDREAAWLRRLVALGRDACDESSKIQVVRRLLRRTSESLILFSEYRDVAEWAASRLTDLGPVVVLHGGLPPATRRAALTAFTTGRARVLSATDAASEGLNLHAGCRLVVNLELPWNPLRLEQRIGRVDRLGQRRRVHALHLLHTGSFEEGVFAHLEARRRRATAACTPVPSSGVPGTGVFAGRAEEVRRLRSIVGATGERAVRGVFARPSARAGRPRTLVLLFVSDVHDIQGRLVQRQLIPLRCALDRRRQPAPIRCRDFLQLAADRRVLDALDDEVGRRVGVLRGVLEESMASLIRRADAIRQSLATATDGELHQPALFDRRSEDRARARTAVVAGWTTHLDHHIRNSVALTRLSAAAPTLVAVWPEV